MHRDTFNRSPVIQAGRLRRGCRARAGPASVSSSHCSRASDTWPWHESADIEYSPACSSALSTPSDWHLKKSAATIGGHPRRPFSPRAEWTPLEAAEDPRSRRTSPIGEHGAHGNRIDRASDVPASPSLPRSTNDSSAVSSGAGNESGAVPSPGRARPFFLVYHRAVN